MEDHNPTTTDPDGPTTPRFDNQRNFRVDDGGVSKDTWSIAMTDSRLFVQNASGSKQFAIEKKEHFKYMDLTESGGRQLLVLRQLVKVVIHVDAQVYDAVDQWRGDSTEEWLRYDLRGFWFKLAISLLFLLPSLADIGRYFRDGAPIGRQGWEGLVLGGIMLAIAIFSRVKPHRYVILLDVGWWLGLLLFQVPPSIHKPGIWTAFWVVFPIIFSYLRYRNYWKHACRMPK